LLTSVELDFEPDPVAEAELAELPPVTLLVDASTDVPSALTLAVTTCGDVELDARRESILDETEPTLDVICHLLPLGKIFNRICPELASGIDA
jgi:hypothetical protein